MSKPAGYPKTDALEQDAVTTLHAALDSTKVKADIKTRDKYPNVDGTLEIVDDERRPEGKFDVQVRKVPAGTVSYSCPVELYAYSKVSSLPVLLIIVDTDNKKVMWRHVFGGMPEYKADQASFTIRFGAEDEIDQAGVYLERWRRITDDYNRRIREFPELSARVSRDMDLEGVEDRDVEYFQRYANELNALLERDFQVIKARMLPSGSRFGIGIASTTEERIEYQHHLVEFGSRQPTVIRLDSKPLQSIFDDSSVLHFTMVERSSLKNPRWEALDFLRPSIEAALKNFRFVVHGEDVACNTLASFVERFPKVFNVQSPAPYNIDDLSRAYYQALPRSCARYLPLPSNPNHIGVINLSHMEEAIKHLPESEFWAPSQLSRYQIEGSEIPIQAFEDSLKFLKASGIETIENPWINPGRLNSPYIWSFVDRKLMLENLGELHQRLIANYSAFVKGNELSLNRSPYLDPRVTVIFNISDGTGEEIASCPIVEEYHIPNLKMILPKVVTLINGGDGRLVSDPSSCMELILDGQKHSATRFSERLLTWPFRQFCYLHGVYQLLTDDLNTQYGYRFSRSW